MPGSRGTRVLCELVESTTLRLYNPDTDSDLRYEPSGQDFLSPILAEADLMRRVMKPQVFARWFGDFLTDVPHGAQTDWLPTATVTDRSDGKLAHLDGLNLSRAWMLEGIASGLPEDDPRRGALEAAGLGPSRSRFGCGDRRALRRRSLAGDLRHVSEQWAGAGGRLGPILSRDVV